MITTEALAAETRQQLPMLPAEHVVAEPVGRDTAACVCLGGHVGAAFGPAATMILLPLTRSSPQRINFSAPLRLVWKPRPSGGLVTYGIAPRFPSTGYGYVKVAEAISQTDDGVSVRAC